MENKLMTGVIIILLSGGLVVACGNRNHNHNHDHSEDVQTEVSASNSEASEMAARTEADQKGAEFTSVYICPMHCEGSGNEVAGTCPACGMDYVFNKAFHSNYICPMHCKGSGGETPGKCPSCGMDYVKKEDLDHDGHDHDDHSDHDHG